MIPAVYLQQLEGFEFLWGQRQAALRSPDYTDADLARLEGRIEAHRDALLLGGEAAVGLLEAGLAGDDPLGVFAAAYTLLQLQRPQLVLDALAKAEGEKLPGLREAFCHGPIEPIRRQLEEALAAGPAPQAAVAAEALAFHGRLPREQKRLAELLDDENPEVRAAAWRVVAMLDGGPCESSWK